MTLNKTEEDPQPISWNEDLDLDRRDFIDDIWTFWQNGEGARLCKAPDCNRGIVAGNMTVDFIVSGIREVVRQAGIEPGTISCLWGPPVPASPPPPPRYRYDQLTDEEWTIIAPHWPIANQARTPPRDIVNALLEIASTGCGWGHAREFTSDEAARQQYRRRARNGVIAALPELLKDRLAAWRVRQFVELAQLSLKRFERND